MKWYVYGEVFFATTQKRNAAGRRLDQRVGQRGFTADVWPLLVEVYGSWPSGRVDVTGLSDTGVSSPGIRFCYSTTDQAAADEAFADITAAWDVFQDTSSWWAYAAVT